MIYNISITSVRVMTGLTSLSLSRFMWRPSWIASLISIGVLTGESYTTLSGGKPEQEELGESGGEDVDLTNTEAVLGLLE